ncbi:MAG: type IV secretion protein DotN [Alphaproteobacteria bacterium]|nr:type IV secretion protein DotN [Alphaproteobacteria bacterium]
MSFLPLTLGVGRKPGAGSGGLKPPSRAEAETILKRDNFTCRFCGFRAVQYQRIVPSPEGYVTACSFCEQVQTLERAALMGGGVLIWLPEITQAELNHIARAIYVARSEKGGSMEAAATRAFDALMTRRVEAKKRLGSDDPLVLATVLHENLDQDERAAASKKLEGVRLLPLDRHMVRSKRGDIDGFPQIVKFWRSAQGPFGKIPAGEWQELFAKIAA